MGGSTYYQIYIRGRVTAGWEDWFGGMEIEAVPDVTRLSGPLPDQSALLGVLDVLHNLGLEVVSVSRLENPPETKDLLFEGDLS